MVAALTNGPAAGIASTSDSKKRNGILSTLFGVLCSGVNTKELGKYFAQLFRTQETQCYLCIIFGVLGFCIQITKQKKGTLLVIWLLGCQGLR